MYVCMDVCMYVYVCVTLREELDLLFFFKEKNLITINQKIKNKNIIIFIVVG